jgi:hypothetical protein
MSGMDETMEEWTVFLVKVVPKAIIPAILSWFIWSLDLSKNAYSQGQKTTRALLTSFYPETIYFLKNCKNIAISSNSIYNPIEIASEYEWTYNSSRKLFVQKDYESSSSKRFSWFSAELFCKDYMISDMTEWIDSTRLHSNKGMHPPSDVILQAWMIDHSRDLGPLEDYSFHVINDLTEKEVIEVRQSKVN